MNYNYSPSPTWNLAARLLAVGSAFLCILECTPTTQAAVDIYDGTYTNTVFADAMGTNIHGGTFNGSVQSNGPPMNISGGTFENEVQSNEGLINISGGDFFSYVSANNGEIKVSGGTFYETLICYGTGSRISIFGGDFSHSIEVGADYGTLTVAGSNFNLDGVPVAYGSIPPGMLTGTLVSGEPIAVRVGLDFSRQGRVILIAPEPVSISLVVVAVYAALGCRRLRKKVPHNRV